MMAEQECSHSCKCFKFWLLNSKIQFNNSVITLDYDGDNNPSNHLLVTCSYRHYRIEIITTPNWRRVEHFRKTFI